MTDTKAILFDLGNVLVPFHPERGYVAFSEFTGLPANEIATRLKNSPVYGDYESGRIDTAEFHATMQDLLQISFGLEPLREAWNRIFLPDTATSETLVAALKRNYRLVLLSNTNELHFDWLRERYSILRHFDAFTLSHEVQAMKPDPKIYAAAVANAQCEAHECFYTDDILNYVEAARSHGIRAELFTGEADLKRHLTNHGIAF
jgi:putative hydrolase of the HAD superfamily